MSILAEAQESVLRQMATSKPFSAVLLPQESLSKAAKGAVGLANLPRKSLEPE
jgi:hypothetical protein